MDVVRRLQQAGYTAFWAGGCVRDMLLGHPPDDYDVATSAHPEQVRTLFGARQTLAIGASFGVILVHGPRRTAAGDVEVATFRTEGPYLDGRRPEHVTFATAEEDAHRRDFTINGMFFDPLTDRVLDYVGGRHDLEAERVRAIGDPAARFREDKLRMLRAVRMTARFDFTLEAATAEAIRAMATEILVVSSERIAQELRKMLVHMRRAAAMRLADELRLLPVILPELRPLLTEPGSALWLKTLSMLEQLEEPGFEVALAALLYQIGQAADSDAAVKSAEKMCRRLKLSNREIEHVAWLTRHRSGFRGARGWPQSRLKRLMAEPLVSDLISLEQVAAACGDGDPLDVAFCAEFLARTPRAEIDPPPLITGDDLIRAGMRPGIRFKELLELVRDAQLDGTIATQDEALELARRSAPG